MKPKEAVKVKVRLSKKKQYAKKIVLVQTLSKGGKGERVGSCRSEPNPNL